MSGGGVDSCSSDALQSFPLFSQQNIICSRFSSELVVLIQDQAVGYLRLVYIGLGAQGWSCLRLYE